MLRYRLDFQHGCTGQYAAAGSQFTSNDFTGTLERHEVTISMDGKGRYMDNIFVERLWRSLKYEEVYLCQRAPKFPRKWAPKIPRFGGAMLSDQP